MPKQIFDWLVLAIGVLIAAVGLNCFLLPNHFIDGGITGISMLLADLTGVSLSVWLIAVNVPFILLAYRFIGKSFAIQSGIAIVGLALAVALIPFPSVTSDKLLGSVLGGFFVGAGVGLAIRCGGVLDGTEILAVMLTNFKTLGGYSGTEQEVIFCVVTRLEITKLESIVKRIDTKAFVVTVPVLDAKGGVVKQRPAY